MNHSQPTNNRFNRNPKRIPGKQIEHKISDNAGNVIYATTGVNGDSITLQLQTVENGIAGIRRTLGVIDKHSRVMTVRRKRAAHLHKKSNSYGFNHYVLTNAKTFDRVEIVDDFGMYVVPVDVLLSNGKILYFKQNGFERQVFVPIETIQQYQRKNIF